MSRQQSRAPSNGSAITQDEQSIRGGETRQSGGGQSARGQTASRQSATGQTESRGNSVDNNSYRENSRNSLQSQTIDSAQTRQTNMSQRSPAISRTPSADRRLLRTLTVSPNAGEINEYDDPTPEESVYSPQQSQYNDRSPAGTPSRNTATRVSKTPSEKSAAGRLTVQLPDGREFKGVSAYDFIMSTTMIWYYIRSVN
ncbi:hypothetical protein ACF0H5_007779 [Mactra antiquata]